MKISKKLTDSLYEESQLASNDVLNSVDELSHKIKLVIKRDDDKHHGEKEKYNIKKIKVAVQAAYNQLNEPLPDNIWRRFNYYLKKCSDQFEGDEISVETLQDIIIKFLMKENPDVAEEYIIYRYKHNLAREKRKNADFEHGLEDKLLAKNVVNQNANVDEYAYGGRMGEATRFVTKKFGLENVASVQAKENHEKNEVYIHK